MHIIDIRYMWSAIDSARDVVIAGSEVASPLVID